jgi:hypothetical protein
MTSPTQQDVRPTPTVTDELMSGPEVQANALWTVLHDLPLRTAPASTLTGLDLGRVDGLPSVARLR